MNIADAENVYMQARRRARQILASFLTEWNKPLLQTEIGLMRGSMSPREAAFLDEDTEKRIEEVLNA